MSILANEDFQLALQIKFKQGLLLALGVKMLLNGKALAPLNGKVRD